MDVLVGYASEHGSTRGVAERLAGRLRSQGLTAEACPVDGAADPGGYRACVLGSAIHSGDWLPAAGEFLQRHAHILACRPVWVFSVSTVGERTSAFPDPVATRLRQVLQLPAAIAAVTGAVQPRGHHRFAGVVAGEHWGLTGRVFMTGLGGRYGDHRDWAEIEAWADGIARDLLAGVAGAAVDPARSA